MCGRVIQASGPDQLLRWGLVPSWASAKLKPGLPINSRAKAPFFREAYGKRRCILPVDGFSSGAPSTARS